MRNILRFTTTAILLAGSLCVGATLAHADEERGYLGVSLAGFSGVSGDRENGVYIIGFEPRSGAEAAGLKEDDQVIVIDEIEIAALDDVETALADAAPGGRVVVRVRRDAAEKDFTVVLGGGPVIGNVTLAEGALQYDVAFNQYVEASQRWAYVVKRDQLALGAQAQTLGSQLAEFFGVEQGALITDVISDGPAWKAGLRAGDVITGWNGERVDGMKMVNEKLNESEEGDRVDLEVRRRDRFETFPVLLERADPNLVSITIDVGEEGQNVKIPLSLNWNVRVGVEDDDE